MQGSESLDAHLVSFMPGDAGAASSRTLSKSTFRSTGRPNLLHDGQKSNRIKGEAGQIFNNS